MAVKLVVGPCGAGKSTYIKKHAKPEDWVIEWDDLQSVFNDPKQASMVRKALETRAKEYTDGDVWISRSFGMGNPEKRTAKTKEIGADQVIVLLTDAETAKQRVQERDLPKEAKDSQLASIDTWWSEYGVVPSDLIVQPSGDPHPSDKDTHEMPPKESTKGFPADTPVAEMEVEEQAAYWKHKARKHETAFKNLTSQHEEYVAAHPEGSNQEIDEAKAEELRNEGRQAALADLLPEKVKAAFSAKVGTRLEADKLGELLEDLNLNNFVKDGEVDLDKVEARVNVFVPQAAPRRTRQTHQGPRSTDEATKSSTLAGAELFESLHGKKG